MIHFTFKQSECPAWNDVLYMYTNLLYLYQHTSTYCPHRMATVLHRLSHGTIIHYVCLDRLFHGEFRNEYVTVHCISLTDYFAEHFSRCTVVDRKSLCIQLLYVHQLCTELYTFCCTPLLGGVFEFIISKHIYFFFLQIKDVFM